MCSELFRIPTEINGVALFGAGILLALWIGGAATWLYRARRSGMSAVEAGSHAPMLLIMAALLYFLPNVFPEGLPIRGYGAMLLLASVSGIGLAVHRARQNNLPADLIYSLAIWLFVCGILGARLFFIIEYWETRFAPLPATEAIGQMLMFTEGGLVVYGSLIGAAAAFLVFCYRHKLPVLALADILAPSLVVGLALGRLGCLLNGCCYGGATDVRWAVTFPVGSPAYQDQLAAGEIRGVYLYEDATTDPQRVLLDGAQLPGQLDSATVAEVNERPIRSMVDAQAAMTRAYWSGEQVTVTLADGRQMSVEGHSNPVHPTQVYSAVNAALLAWLTWTFYPFRRRDGEVIGLLLTLYPISRIVLEHIRTDEAAVFGTGLSISQNVSLGLLAAGVVYWVWLLRRPRRLALCPPAVS